MPKSKSQTEKNATVSTCSGNSDVGMNTPQAEWWEMQFDEKFMDLIHEPSGKWLVDPAEVKSFIHQELSALKDKVREAVGEERSFEKMQQNFEYVSDREGGRIDGHNTLRSRVLKVIE